MARTSRRGTPVSARSGSRDRHGRGIRSSVTGPYLPPLSTRAETFESTVAATAGYLRDLWPDELAETRFEVAGLPADRGTGNGVARWKVIPAEQRVILFRLPVERLTRLHRSDAIHRRMLVESCVFRAVAELLGKDPWELAPDRYGHSH